ncbi:hypothetical protein BAE44_0006972 [Dichanthelium oligosanthes]|uniref:Uncharacterized protein n=1 Tax=Dichanthelium oligosanthes TaxID=888268 RepID=A0A1E5W3Y9_9POAL|nr:hypothetical protein BAE44_0006972 [Dichanthelium oligosanthes]
MSSDLVGRLRSLRQRVDGLKIKVASILEYVYKIPPDPGPRRSPRSQHAAANTIHEERKEPTPHAVFKKAKLQEDLVKPWIAEGFILEGKSIVKIAGSYFDVLVSLGLIQRIDIDYCSKQQHRREVEEEEEPSQHSKRLSYVVHPRVFEFITYKSKEENFITIIDYSQSKVALTGRIHRLSLHFGSATYATTPTSIRLSRIRSLAFMGLLNCMLSLHEFKVRCNVTVELPGQVQCLKHLKTLEINAGVADFPSDIVHHSTLQHVRIGKKGRVQKSRSRSCYFHRAYHPGCFPAGRIRQLSSLHILEVVRELGKYELDHLGMLPELGVLSLYVRKPARGVVTFHTEALFPALEYFKLVSGVLWLSFPEKAMPKLLRLKICFNARRGDNYSHVLGGIQHLEKLKEVASIGVATGADETDCIAAECALQDAPLTSILVVQRSSRGKGWWIQWTKNMTLQRYRRARRYSVCWFTYGRYVKSSSYYHR